MITKMHQYSDSKLSPWPLVSSVNGFNVLLSMLMFFKFSNYSVLTFSMILVIASSMMWWNNYVKEFNQSGEVGSFNMESSIKGSMLLFISSEVLFFVSFFWSYYHFMSAPVLEASIQWPPFHMKSFDFLNVPMINTLILLTSGVTITISHDMLLSQKLKSSSIFLSMTFLLGMLFTLLQALEYSSSFFTISDSTFGSTFFMLTGFHGIHVILGFIFLMVVAKNMAKLYSWKKSFLSFELASWYWHFVDVIWIKVYFLLYYLNG